MFGRPLTPPKFGFSYKENLKFSMEKCQLKIS